MPQLSVVTRTRDFIRGKFENDATGHDWWHIERVWRTARWLAEQEGADLLVVDLAALLHDVADWKFHAGDETAGPRAAREWLVAEGVSPPVVEHVCEIIACISFKGAGVPTPMASVEGEVVQDADRLDAIGAIGIARTFAYGGHAGNVLHDPHTPPLMHASFADYKSKSCSTINHFHEKLLLLRERMNTAAARRLAADRHAFMEEFLNRFDEQWRFPEA